MREALAREFDGLVRYPAGKRFQDRYRKYHASRRGIIQKITMLTIGLVLVLAGLMMMVAPGPGILVFLLGGVLLAEQSYSVAVGMDWLEVRLRKIFLLALHGWHKLNLPLKIACVILALLLATSIAAGAWWYWFHIRS